MASANAQGEPTSITVIGWWVSAADIRFSGPTVSIDLAGRENSFTVTQAEFDNYQGQWYLVDANDNNWAKAGAGAVFNVRSPMPRREYQRFLPKWWCRCFRHIGSQ